MIDNETRAHMEASHGSEVKAMNGEIAMARRAGDFEAEGRIREALDWALARHDREWRAAEEAAMPIHCDLCGGPEGGILVGYCHDDPKALALEHSPAPEPRSPVCSCQFGGECPMPGGAVCDGCRAALMAGKNF